MCDYLHEHKYIQLQQSGIYTYMKIKHICVYTYIHIPVKHLINQTCSFTLNI